MGIRTFVTIGFSLVVLSAHAATNSWNSTLSDFWDEDTRWSLGHAPAIADAAEFITNATTKTVTIDDTDTLFFQSTLTISNLTVMGTGTATNTLSLTNMNGGALIPLKVLNNFSLGTNGQLQVSFSTLQVGNASFGAGSKTLLALGTNSSPIVVSNNLSLAGTLNIADSGGFFSNTSYTLFTYGGTLVNNGITVGSTPSNATCTIDTSVAGLVKLSVSGGPPPPTGSLSIISIVRSGNDITLTWTAAASGNNTVQAENGNMNTNNFADISATIPVTAGVTNSYTDVGGATNTPARFYRIHGF